MTIQERHNNKITNLTKRAIESIPEPTHKFHTRTVNTTDVNFTTDEMDLLNKGLKHNLKCYTTNNKNHKRHIRDIITDTETAVQNTHLNDQDPIRHDIKRKLQNTHTKPKIHNNEIKTLNKVKQKLHEHNITCLLYTSRCV